MSRKQDKTIRLHVADDGRLWYGTAKLFAESTDTGVPEFLAGQRPSGVELAEASAIRVLGTRRNAALILELRKRYATGPTIMLASPQMFRTKEARHDPESVMAALWQPDTSCRLPGYWHKLSDTDLITYAMWAEYEKTKQITARILALAESHPAWMAVSFIPEYAAESGARLLMAILDPRWYTHALKPHRFSKVHAHLGLTPRNARALLKDDPPDRHYERAGAAFTAWYNVNSVQVYTTGGASTAAHFLWRLFRHKPSDVRGLIAATKKLVELISYVWLEAVSSSPGERYFQPESFFHSVSECQAFRRHGDLWRMV